jgi:para-aminobenzoate synthetase/4-amino-4-deoxychorismate lyase
MRTLIDFRAPQSDPTAAVRQAFDHPVQTLIAKTPAEVRPLLDQIDTLARQGHWCIGYLRFEAAQAFDAAFTTHPADGPLACFAVYDQARPWPEDDKELPSASVQWHSPLQREDFNQRMDQIHQAIAAGDLYQVNYTAPLQGELQGDAQALFMALRRAQPQGYAAFLDTGSEQVLSVSPELFFDWQDHRIRVRPMKGTAPRGSSPAEDQRLTQALRTSPKERAENVMIVDLLRNDLSRIAQPFSVKTPRLFHVETLPTVFQMVSDVQALTRPGTTLADVFSALFPCGSITGAPKVRAMQLIQHIEPEARGVYCGTVGVVRPGGHATFNVAIRTVTVRGQAARCGIGSGITFDATADDEWQEWRHKRGFLERASQRFSLLETLRLEHGQWRDAPLHVARLARAAAHFGYPLAAAALQGQLHALSQSQAHGVWRVRLLLASDGQISATAYPLEASPERVVLKLATTALDAADSEFVRFKTTHRAHYDAYAPQEPTVFDTLLYNRHGELTECTRGNIAVHLDGRWVTPPLRCGLLDGVARARYLQSGELTEAVVRLQDLPRAQGLAFVNSLRGWLAAELL